MKAQRTIAAGLAYVRHTRANAILWHGMALATAGYGRPWQAVADHGRPMLHILSHIPQLTHPGSSFYALHFFFATLRVANHPHVNGDSGHHMQPKGQPPKRPALPSAHPPRHDGPPGGGGAGAASTRRLSPQSWPNHVRGKARGRSPHGGSSIAPGSYSRDRPGDTLPCRPPHLIRRGKPQSPHRSTATDAGFCALLPNQWAPLSSTLCQGRRG